MFASPEKRRGIYERLANILPGDPYVLQHRAILERELGDADLSVKYAREAVKLNSMNQSFLNTLGLALELQSRESDELKRQVLLFEANRLFEDNIRYDSNSAFGYVGKAAIIKNKFEHEKDKENKGELLAEGLALLDDALEFTDESPIVATEIVWFRRKLGELGDIVEVVRSSLEKNQADVRLRRMLIQFKTDAGSLQEAVVIGMDGIRYNPTSWLLNRDIARLKRSLGEPTTVVKGFFETAVRHNKGDLSLAIEFGSFLFERGNYAEYNRLFRDIDLLPAAGNEKTRIRNRVRQGTSLKTFKGTVKLVRGATAYVTLDPEGIDVFFWLSDSRLRSLRERNRVTCHIGFNSKGAIAFDVDRV